jgi:Transposase, Mutator family
MEVSTSNARSTRRALDAAETGAEHVLPTWDAFARPAKREIIARIVDRLVLSKTTEPITRWTTDERRYAMTRIALRCGGARPAVEWLGASGHRIPCPSDDGRRAGQHAAEEAGGISDRPQTRLTQPWQCQCQQHVREGARRMLAAALEAEVAAYIAAYADDLDERGHRLVVRNGHAVPRQVLTSAGAVPVRAPRVNDKRVDETTGERRQFSSAILPAWCRKSPKITEVLPLLYLHGLSSKDFVPALEGFLGTDAGLSAATITRLTTQWQDDARRFADRDLSSVDYVYVWADGVHLNVRLEEEKLCLLVMIGVRVDGTKELVAFADGYRESTGSWADLLRDCKRRGMRAPVLAVGDGALGFWGALQEVFPEAREQAAGSIMPTFGLCRCCWWIPCGAAVLGWRGRHNPVV